MNTWVNFGSASPLKVGQFSIGLNIHGLYHVLGDEHGFPVGLRDKALIRFTETQETSHDGVRDKGLITFTVNPEKSTGGRPGTEYRVSKRDSFVVVAQLSPEFTA